MSESITLRIITDLRVHDLINILKNVNGITNIRQIDSVNYGEGYDFEINDIPARIFDDIRSDMAVLDSDFIKGEIPWDQAFKRIMRRSEGNCYLTIEIDRHEIAPVGLRQASLDKVAAYLIDNGFMLKLNP